MLIENISNRFLCFELLFQRFQRFLGVLCKNIYIYIWYFLKCKLWNQIFRLCVDKSSHKWPELKIVQIYNPGVRKQKCSWLHIPGEEWPHASIQFRGSSAGDELCREGPADCSGQQVGHKPAMWLCGQESQWYPWVH